MDVDDDVDVYNDPEARVGQFLRPFSEVPVEGSLQLGRLLPPAPDDPSSGCSGRQVVSLLQISRSGRPNRIKREAAERANPAGRQHQDERSDFKLLINEPKSSDCLMR